MSEHTKRKLKAKKSDGDDWVIMYGNVVVAPFRRKDFPEHNEIYAKELVHRWNSQPNLLNMCKNALIGIAEASVRFERGHYKVGQTMLTELFQNIEATIAKAKKE